MARTQYLQANFSGGEFSPQAMARGDYERWQRGATRIENFFVRLEGGLEKRHGTRYVATVEDPTRPVRLEPFIFRAKDALILAFGQLTLRFFKNGAPILSGGLPYTLTTPYTASRAHELWCEQKNDVVYIFHWDYLPRKLQRLADDQWTLSAVNPYPPPTSESGRSPDRTLTLSAMTGSSVTATASAASFEGSDVDRELTAGPGRAIIIDYTSDTQVTVEVIDPFVATTFAGGDWTIGGSPVAELKPSKAGPVGATVRLHLRKIQPDQPDLIVDGEFPSLTNWTDISAPVLLSGTHTGTSNKNELEDNTKSFAIEGVVSGMVVQNTTDNNTAFVNVPGTTICTVDSISGGVENDYDTGDAYVIRKTGSATLGNMGVILRGGAQGLGGIRQAISTVAGLDYRVTFEAAGQPVAAQVGSVAGASDLAAERAYSPSGAAHEIIFRATGTQAWVEFRNNQNVDAIVRSVHCRLYSIEGWVAGDVGKYVYAHGGTVRITEVLSAYEVRGQVVALLSSAGEASAGSWTLEDIVWNPTNGYPRVGIFHEQRLVLASLPAFPQRVLGSASNQRFENFLRTPEADAAFDYTLVELKGPIYWLMAPRALLIGAEGTEMSLYGENGNAISATAAPQTDAFGTSGSAPVRPLHIGSSVLFCQRNGSALVELTFDANTLGSYDAEDLTQLSGHLLDRTEQITQLAWAPEPKGLPLVLAVRSDGVLLVLTYNRKERVVAWQRHLLGGGGVVRSVAVIPHPTRNASQIWLVVEREIGGTTTQYVEVLDDTAVGVDSAVVYSGPAITTLTGLEHLEGESIRLAGIATGKQQYAVMGEKTVLAGSVALDFAATQVYAGVPYVALAETLPVELPGAATLQTQRKRWDDAQARVYNTGYGLAANGKYFDFRQKDDDLEDGIPLRTGDYKQVSYGWTEHGKMVWTHDEPLPCTLLSIGGHLTVGEQ